jgi:DNA modification methylase
MWGKLVNLADKIVMRPIGALIPYASNSRTHTPEQISLIARSIETFGFTNPILVDGANGVVAGHARLKAAQKLGLGEVPTIELAWLTPAERQAYVIADNQTAITGAGWDPEMLRLELGDLKLAGFDLTLTGFGELELGSLLADNTDGLTDPDDAPAAPEHPVSHEPHLMVTDPPYGVEYDPAWRHTARRSTGELLSVGKHSMGAVSNDDRDDWREAWSLFPGDIAYVWHSGLHCRSVQESLEAAGFQMRSQIIWNKNVMIISRGHYHFKHEPCWYAVRKGKTANWAGDRKQTSVWDIPIVHATAGNVDDGKNSHGTQKPVECMRRPIENNSSPGLAVYEPFCGSGTTIIAAEMTGRSCHAIEISPPYIDVAVKRWQDFTGKQATLDGDGRAFDQIAAERQPQAASSEASAASSEVSVAS